MLQNYARSKNFMVCKLAYTAITILDD